MLVYSVLVPLWHVPLFFKKFFYTCTISYTCTTICMYPYVYSTSICACTIICMYACTTMACTSSCLYSYKHVLLIACTNLIACTIFSCY